MQPVGISWLDNKFIVKFGVDEMTGENDSLGGGESSIVNMGKVRLLLDATQLTVGLGRDAYNTWQNHKAASEKETGIAHTITNIKHNAARTLFSQRRYSESIKLFAEANSGCQFVTEEEKITRSAMYYDWSLALYMFQKTQEAIAKLKELLSFSSDDRDALNLLGLLYFEANEANKAIKNFNASLKLQPDQNSIRARLAFLYRKWEDVVTYVTYAEVEKNADNKLFKMQGIANFEMRKYAQAAHSFVKALRMISHTVFSFNPKKKELFLQIAKSLQEHRTDASQQAISTDLLTSMQYIMSLDIEQMGAPISSNVVETTTEESDLCLQNTIIHCYQLVFSLDSYDIDALQCLAKYGDAAAQAMLGECYANGYGVEINYFLAEFWCRKSVKRQNPDGLNNMGMLHYKGRGVSKDNKKAFEYFSQAIASGSLKGLCNLGILRKFGHGVRQDKKQAFKDFKKASENGSLAGLCNLGVCHYEGCGIGRNHVEAKTCFKKVLLSEHCRNGVVKELDIAKIYLGIIFLHGLVKPSKDKDSTRVQEDLAEVERRGDNALALYVLSEEYYKGYLQKDGVDHNAYKKAVNLFTRAVEIDPHLCAANLALGICYYEGYVVTRDYELAYKYFMVAAQDGDPEANSYLGRMHYHGHGIKVDYVEAMRLCKLANQMSNSAQASSYVHFLSRFHDAQKVNPDVPQSNHPSNFFTNAKTFNSKPVIATNGKVIIEMHQKSSANELFYRVGTISDDHNIDWQSVAKFGEGVHPSLAINQKGNIIVLFNLFNDYRKFVTRIGQLQSDGSTVAWEDYDKVVKKTSFGTQPTVALTNAGEIIEVHKSENYDTLYYRIGAIVTQDNLPTCKRKNGGGKEFSKGAINPHICICELKDNAYIIVVYSDASEAMTYYRLGRVNFSEKNISWNENCYPLGKVIEPTLFAKTDGSLITVCRDVNSPVLKYRRGKLQGSSSDLELEWDNNWIDYDFGYHPAIISCGDENNEVTTLQVYDGHLCTAYKRI